MNELSCLDKRRESIFLSASTQQKHCAKRLGIADRFASLVSDPQSDRHLVIGLSLQ